MISQVPSLVWSSGVLYFAHLRRKVAVQGRYKISMFLDMLTGSLQGIAERPLPCIYNEIHQNDAISRR